MKRLTAEQVAAELRNSASGFADHEGPSDQYGLGYVEATIVGISLIESNLIESPDERRKRFERWMQGQWPRVVDPWKVWNAALDFGGGGGE